MVTLPLNTGDLSSCQKVRLLFFSAEGKGLAFSFNSRVGSRRMMVMPSSTAKMARQPMWFNSQAPTNGASAGESATNGIMVAKTRLALPSR
ncbi:hypothetical protein D3C73_1340250 [compost metagenome]